MTKQDYIEKLIDAQRDQATEIMEAMGAPRRLIPVFIEKTKEILAEVFEDDEMALLCEVNCSPVGRKMNKKLPQYMQRCAQLGQELAVQSTLEENLAATEGFADYFNTKH